MTVAGTSIEMTDDTVLPRHEAAALRTACEAARDADGIFAAVGETTLRLLGPGLLTINAWRPQTSQVVRLWSSDPVAYPVGGSKHKGDTPWARRVLWHAEVFVGEGDAALAEVFDDIATIRGLGLTAVVNVPVVAGREAGRRTGPCAGTFNYLAARTQWRPDEVRLLEALAAFLVPAFASLDR